MEDIADWCVKGIKTKAEIKKRIIEAMSTKTQVTMDLNLKQLEELILRCGSARESVVENNIENVQFFIDTGKNRYGFRTLASDSEATQKPSRPKRKGKRT